MLEKKRFTALFSTVLLVLLGSCGGEPPTDPPEPAPVQVTETDAPALQAGNAFFYYRDVEKAWQFYTNVLGFETVVDYGFAKILRVAESSYLTLVDEKRGMHTAEEPKSVTMALVTSQLEGWYDYLKSQQVPLHSELKVAEGRPHDGFVAIDPEGYFLEFERFNPHPENAGLMPRLAELPPLTGRKRPPELTIQATVIWLYYRDVPRMERFYESLLGVPLLVDQGWAKVYPVAGSSLLGLVDGSRGLHPATEKKGVTVSFFTASIEPWFERAKSQPEMELRNPELGSESGRVTTFVAYDPEGYFLEWDTFLPVAGNEILLGQLQDRQR